MITKEQALTASEFHYGACKKRSGPRGGVKVTQEIWRRNGATKTLKTQPHKFEVPVKHGLRDYGRVRSEEAASWHTSEECPLYKHEQPDLA